MENLIYTINLAVHNIALVLCAAAPFYQLRMVAKRQRFGKKIFYEMDSLMEEILSQQPKLCFAFILILITSGFGFPLIHYAFHGAFRATSTLAYIALSLKTLLVLVGLGIVIYGMTTIDKRIQALFKTFAPGVQPEPEALSRFFSLRATRRKWCKVCFVLAMAILVITPILRFY